MIKLISRFCTLTKYYPTKLVQPKEWVHDYIPVFKQRQFSESELKSDYYFQIARITPLAAYSCYWILLGPMNALHVAGFTALLLIYVQQRHTQLVQQAKKPISLFMDKNGMDYIAIYNLNAAELNKGDPSLREIFQLNEKQGIIKFNVNDIKIVRSGVQPKSEYEFLNLFLDPDTDEEMSKKPHNIFEIEAKDKQLLIKFSQNEHSGMNEYLSALMNKKQIVIK